MTGLFNESLSSFAGASPIVITLIVTRGAVLRTLYHPAGSTVTTEAPWSISLRPSPASFASSGHDRGWCCRKHSDSCNYLRRDTIVLFGSCNKKVLVGTGEYSTAQPSHSTTIKVCQETEHSSLDPPSPRLDPLSTMQHPFNL